MDVVDKTVCENRVIVRFFADDGNEERAVIRVTIIWDSFRARTYDGAVLDVEATSQRVRDWVDDHHDEIVNLWIDHVDDVERDDGGDHCGGCEWCCPARG